MATHPVEPETTDIPGDDAAAPNPSRLPVEPEFGSQMPTPEPEDPAPQHPRP